MFEAFYEAVAGLWVVIVAVIFVDSVFLKFATRGLYCCVKNTPAFLDVDYLLLTADGSETSVCRFDFLLLVFSRMCLLESDCFRSVNGRSLLTALIEVVDKLLAKLPRSNSESFIDFTPSFSSRFYVSIRVLLNLSATFAICSLAAAAVKFFVLVFTWTEL